MNGLDILMLTDIEDQATAEMFCPHEHCEDVGTGETGPNLVCHDCGGSWF